VPPECIGNFELRSPEPANEQSLWSRREESGRINVLPDEISGSLDIEQRSPADPETGHQRRRELWPWAWLALTGLATLGWVIGLGWVAFAVVRWLIG
jgi:hypothetical protein